MKDYIFMIITLIFFNSSLFADNCCYNFLGINANKSKKITKIKVEKKRNIIKITKHALSKKSTKNPISKILKHTKIKKLSEDTTLYGVGAEYKISKKVQLSLDILAEVDIKNSSLSVQEKTAQVKFALSI